MPSYNPSAFPLDPRNAPIGSKCMNEILGNLQRKFTLAIITQAHLDPYLSDCKGPFSGLVPVILCLPS